MWILVKDHSPRKKTKLWKWLAGVSEKTMPSVLLPVNQLREMIDSSKLLHLRTLHTFKRIDPKELLLLGLFPVLHWLQLTLSLKSWFSETLSNSVHWHHIGCLKLTIVGVFRENQCTLQIRQIRFFKKLFLVWIFCF